MNCTKTRGHWMACWMKTVMEIYTSCDPNCATATHIIWEKCLVLFKRFWMWTHECRGLSCPRHQCVFQVSSITACTGARWSCALSGRRRTAKQAESGNTAFSRTVRRQVILNRVYRCSIHNISNNKTPSLGMGGGSSSMERVCPGISVSATPARQLQQGVHSHCC